jgi:hypothetical protein
LLVFVALMVVLWTSYLPARTCNTPPRRIDFIGTGGFSGNTFFAVGLVYIWVRHGWQAQESNFIG